MRRSAASSLPIENGIVVIAVRNGAPPSAGYCSRTGVCGVCSRMGSVRIVSLRCKSHRPHKGQLTGDNMPIKYRARFPLHPLPRLLGVAGSFTSRDLYLF